MSTSYRIAGRGTYVTLEKWERLAAQMGGSLPDHPDNSDGQRLLDTGRGSLWLFRTGKVAWNLFERFGTNHRAADYAINCLNAAGYTVLSEHDEGYFR